MRIAYTLRVHCVYIACTRQVRMLLKAIRTPLDNEWSYQA